MIDLCSMRINFSKLLFSKIDLSLGWNGDKKYKYQYINLYTVLLFICQLTTKREKHELCKWKYKLLVRAL
ncbi:hypothetical protein VIBNISOn1_1050031 [Vibrio nigripulchritudo SOn1]|uniref:Uncharacterized protein n=1 Tax=Vibrio nigripulchritudo SOn1 TaxID=1238450 RepID=A0AAV2VHT5_9VIBR|nr:hypothetical protein VIBNISOn1_1050031 [Vibrio nigripulchritudo SOn1]